jgi:heptosyltransferase-2
VLIILFGRLGDVVMATSVATALRRHTPGTHLTWLTGADAVPLLLGHPDIDRVLTADPGTLFALRMEKFDLMVNLDRSIVASALAMQIEATHRAGFGYSASGAVVPLDPATRVLVDINRHPSVRAANHQSWTEIHYAIAGLDLSQRMSLPSLVLRPEEDAAALAWRRRTVVAGERLLLCCIGSHVNDPQKRWPAGHWRRLWANLARVPGLRPVVHAGPHEASFHTEVTSHMPPGTRDGGVAADLREVMARVRSADAVVTGDSLALHLAMALGRPVVALFGPTNPAFVQPAANAVLLRGKAACPPCHARSCRHVATTEPLPCLAEILPDTVEGALRGLMVHAEGGTDYGG